MTKLYKVAFFNKCRIISNIYLITYNLSPFYSKSTAFHFTYKNCPCCQNIQFGKEEHSINMLCKILAFFILPCLVISFKMDMKPALKGNLSFSNEHNFHYICAVITEQERSCTDTNQAKPSTFFEYNFSKFS
jgi:hypothetical protein